MQAGHLRFLQRLRTWPVFGKGWGRRVAEVKAAALAMAAHAPPAPMPASASTKDRADKGVVPVAGAAQQGSAAVVVAAGAAAAQQAHQVGHPIWLVACIAGVALGGVAGVWLFWRARQKKQQEKPA
jgi:lysozyme family protein